MNSNPSEIVAAWIVALALLAATAVHVFLPDTPPRLGHGVADANAARIGTALSGGSATADSDLPLVEFADWFGLRSQAAMSATDLGGIPPTTVRPTR